MKIPEHLRNKDDAITTFFIECYFELDTCRVSSGFGLNSINIFDIRKYSELIEYRDIEEFVKLMRLIDNFYISEVNKKQNKKG